MMVPEIIQGNLNPVLTGVMLRTARTFHKGEGEFPYNQLWHVQNNRGWEPLFWKMTSG